MSKIVTTRYEYVCYDDAASGASLTTVPPTYPSTLDQYGSTTIGSTASGYGIQNVNSTGAAQTVTLPANALTYIVAPSSNTTMISLSASTTTVPSGTAYTATVLCGPGQTITVPAAWPGSVITIAACNPSGSTTQSTSFAAQIFWSF